VEEDFKKILESLLQNQVFIKTPGRYHSAYKTMSANPLSGISKESSKLRKWVENKRKQYAIYQEIDTDSVYD
jgi:hypothetical protein